MLQKLFRAFMNKCQAAKGTMLPVAKKDMNVMAKRTGIIPTNINEKAMEGDPEVYGYYPESLEEAYGFQRKQLHARMRGDDRYELKMYYRNGSLCEHQKNSKDFPNLVPGPGRVRIMACYCYEDKFMYHSWFLHKGIPKRCKCGHWFLMVDPEDPSVQTDHVN